MSEQPEKHVDEDIQVYLSGGMSAEERRAFEAHVAGCAACASALAEARELENVMTTMFAGARPGVGFEDRVIRGLWMARNARRTLVHPMVRRVAMGVAAAVVVGGMGVVVNSALNGKRTGMGFALISAGADRNVDELQSMAQGVEGYSRDFGSRGVVALPAAVAPQSQALGTVLADNSPAKVPDTRGGLAWGAERKPYEPAREEKKVEAQIANGRVLGRGFGEDKGRDGGVELSFRPDVALRVTGLATDGEKLKELADVDAKRPTLLPQLGQGGGGGQTQVNNELFQDANKQVKAGVALGGRLGEPAVAGKPVEVEDLSKQVPDFAGAPAFGLDASQASTQPANVRKVIRNGTMQFEVDRFDDALMRVTKLVVEQGGYVATTDSDKLPNGKMKGTVTLRVPPEHLDAVVLMLRGIGDLKSQKVGAEDVSKHYTDLESQLRAAHAMQDRLLEIIKTGKGQIKDLLEAEKQLGVWREKIEQIEGEKRYIDNAVALSTLTVEMAERDIRTPATASEVEQVSMSLETDKVDDAYEKARSAIEAAKGRIIQSELKQFDAGQFGATIQASVPPDAAEQVIARLRQLDGRIAHFERQNKRTTKAGDGPITGLTPLRREDAVISMQIYNLANIAPRRTTSVVLATPGVEAAYQKTLEQIRSAGGRVVTSSLSRPDAQQQTAELDFQVPTDKSQTVDDALHALGDVMRNEATENPDTANVTDAKRGFHLRIVSSAAVAAREVQDAQLAAADVPAAFNQILAAVNSAGGRVLQSELKEQDPHDKQATIAFEIPRSSLAGLNIAVDKAAQILTRNVTRAQDAENTLDSKLRMTYSLISVERLPARQTVTMREEVSDVEKAADDLTNAAVSAGGRRLSNGEISQDPAGHVTAQVIVEVPIDKAPAILDQLERAGRRRSKQVGYDNRVPEGVLARARIDVTFSNSAASLGGEESTWDAIRRGLETSALGLRWSLQMLIIGLCFVAPWVLVLWAGWKIARRKKRVLAPVTT